MTTNDDDEQQSACVSWASSARSTRWRRGATSWRTTRWCASMAGEEYARVHAWGHDPLRRGDYEAASPCATADLPQTLLEPLLVRTAAHGGFRVRFDTTLVALTLPPRGDAGADGRVTAA